MYKKPTFPTIVILVITFFLAIGYSVNNAHAQETVSKSVAVMGGVDNYDVSETNIVYNFNELSPNPFLVVFESEKITFNAVEAQNQSERLSLEISNSQESYLQAEPIFINFKLSNQTNQPILWRGALGQVSKTNFIVTNDAGVQSRFDGNKIKTAYIYSSLRKMQPGEQFQQTAVLIQELLEELLLNPGQYDLRVEFVYDGNTEEERRIKILSNSIPIKIVEPQGIDKQAHQYIKEKLNVSNIYRLDTRTLAQLRQQFVDRYRNSVYAKYIIFSLGTSYQARGEDAKALRELCKIHGENFYFSEDVEKIVIRIGERLNPVIWGPGLPIPVIKHPCTGKVIN